MAGIVAIVGRPNVGKSTLFNQMTKSRSALVADQAGVTRDRIYGIVDIDGECVDIVDTGGFAPQPGEKDKISPGEIWRQTTLAIEEADAVILVLDGKAGLHPDDVELERFLRKVDKQVIRVVNKMDGREQHNALWEFYGLGVTGLLPISAAHNQGLPALKQEILQNLQGHSRQKKRSHSINMALIGKPNAGKSSILNRLLGEERSVVSNLPGTTRDAIDACLSYKNEVFRIVDTAGIRRKARITDALESQSVIQGLQRIASADVVVLVIDAQQGFSEQDARLAALVVERHKPLILVINKWDLVQKSSNTAKEYAEDLYHQIKGLAFVPILFVSCKTNQRVHGLLEKILFLHRQASKRADTSQVNAALQAMVAEHTPELIKRNINKRVKFFFATQVATRPPTFVVMCNVAKEIKESYKRYMLKKFRKALGFNQVPIRIIFRGKKEVRDRALAQMASQHPESRKGSGNQREWVGEVDA